MRVIIEAELNPNSRVPKWLIDAAASGVVFTIKTTRPHKKVDTKPLQEPKNFGVVLDLDGGRP